MPMIKSPGLDDKFSVLDELTKLRKELAIAENTFKLIIQRYRNIPDSHISKLCKETLLKIKQPPNQKGLLL